jgi:cytoskeletal protein CcmA (bactofilin family)
MKRTPVLVLLLSLVVLLSGCTTMSTSGDYTLKRGKTLQGNLMVTSGSATLEEDSRVTGSVFVTSGTLNVGTRAEIEGDVIATSGDVRLGPRAVVRGDVIMTSGRVIQDESARVEGKVSTDGLGFSGWIVNTCCLPPVVLLLVLFYWFISLIAKRPTPDAPAGCTSSLVGGVVLILIGALILVQNLTDLHLRNWWALFILIPALSSLVTAWRIFRAQGRLGAARGPLVGGAVLLLVVIIFVFNLSWGTMWPLFLIIIGVGALIAR